MEELLRQIEAWNESSEFTHAIAAIEAIPPGERTFPLTLWLGRLYSNLAVLGDHNQRAYLDERGRRRRFEPDSDRMRKAIDILLSVQAEGEQDPTWNSRLAMVYSAAQEHRKALVYARRWLELAPGDPGARHLVEEIQKHLSLTAKGKKKY